MNPKPVIPRLKAIQDVEQAIDYCASEFGERAARGLIDALQTAYERVGQIPAGGSPRYAHELGLAGLRSWSLQSHPYVIFYIELENHLDIWRVLHAQMDIPTSLQAPD